MNEHQLPSDLHWHANRHRSGGEVETKRTLELAGLDRSRLLKIAEIGCGTGTASILFAQGGYIPTCNHGMPAEVTLENYKYANIA